MKALSDDLRLRIHEACEDGDASSEVAERFGVSSAFVRRLRQRFRETGSIAPRPGGRGPKPKLAGREAELRQAVADRPDDTPAEHGRRLGLGVSDDTVWRAMRRLGLTFKKTSGSLASPVAIGQPDRIAWMNFDPWSSPCPASRRTPCDHLPTMRSPS